MYTTHLTHIHYTSFLFFLFHISNILCCHADVMHSLSTSHVLTELLGHRSLLLLLAIQQASPLFQCPIYTLLGWGKLFMVCTKVASCPTLPPAPTLPLFRYGYRGNDCRNNLRLLKSDEVVYHTGFIVVMFNPERKSQRHYTEHTSDVRR